MWLNISRCFICASWHDWNSTVVSTEARNPSVWCVRVKVKRRNQTTRLLVQRQESPKNWPPDVILKAMIYSCRNIYINWILRRIFSLANDFNYDSSGKGCWQHIACRETQNRLQYVQPIIIGYSIE